MIEQRLQQLDFKDISQVAANAYLEVITQKINEQLITKLTLQNHPTLKTVHLKSWSPFGFARLTHVTLKGSSGIGEGGLSYLSEIATQLVYLDLSENINLTGFALYTGWFGTTPEKISFLELQDLNVSGCPNLKEMNFSMPKLIRLKINDNPKLVKTQSTLMDNLNYINFKNTSSLGDGSTALLLGSRPQWFLLTSQRHMCIKHDKLASLEHLNFLSRFLNGKLIFDNGEGQRKEFSFNAFADTLMGEFDLSGLKCNYNGTMHNVNKYLRIKVGVRTRKENEDKTTVWFTPKFMVDALSSHPWKDVEWSSDVGIFWSWGNYGLDSFDYLTKMRFDEISSQNLLKLHTVCHWRGGQARAVGGVDDAWGILPHILIKFE